jgi:hypothetical protein
MSSCRECRHGIAHCHGTLIRHSRFRAECTENECTSSELIVHTYLVDCDAIGCDCDQQTFGRLTG